MQLLLGQAPNARRTVSSSQGSKRGCQGVNDSTHLAKDLVSAGMPIALYQCTYISVVPTVHSDIPVTSQSDQKPSKNQTEDQQDIKIVIKLLTKHLASSPLRVKAANDKSPTIVTPILTAEHQLRHFPLGTAAVTNARPDGTGEQTLSAPPGETAPWSPSLAGSHEGIASVKPPLVKEITIKLPKSKSLIHQGALETAMDDKETKDLNGPV